MKILYLGKDAEFSKFLGQTDEVLMTEELIDLALCTKFSPELIVSYNYRHILKNDILKVPKFGSVNLHISFLPYNRGADPNIWSHIEGTPTGVSVHLMDEGIDAGPLITQKLVQLPKEITLEESWLHLQNQVKELFKEVFPLLRVGNYVVYEQNQKGTFHLAKNRPGLPGGFKIRIEDIQKINELGG